MILGVLAVRGHEGLLAVFEPWPDDTSMAWRERYPLAPSSPSIFSTVFPITLRGSPASTNR